MRGCTLHSTVLVNPDDCVFAAFQDAAHRAKKTKRDGRWVDVFDLRRDLNFLARRIVKMYPMPGVSKREQRRIVLATLEGLCEARKLQKSRSGRWMFRRSLILQWNEMRRPTRSMQSNTRGHRKETYVNSPSRRPIPAAV